MGKSSWEYAGSGGRFLRLSLNLYFSIDAELDAGLL